MQLTYRQRAVLQIICAGNIKALTKEWEPVDMDQLLEQYPMNLNVRGQPVTKETMQFHIRALIRKGLIRKADKLVLRRGRNRQTYLPTDKGRAIGTFRIEEDESIKQPEVAQILDIGIGEGLPLRAI